MKSGVHVTKCNKLKGEICLSKSIPVKIFIALVNPSFSILPVTGFRYNLEILSPKEVAEYTIEGGSGTSISSTS